MTLVSSSSPLYVPLPAKEIGRQIYTHIERQIETKSHGDRVTKKQKDRDTVRQTDRHTHRDAERQRDKGTWILGYREAERRGYSEGEADTER